MKSHTDLQRKILSLFAIALGTALMIGESWRSLGQGRPFQDWFDDFVIAAFLFLCAFKAISSARNIKYLSAAFGVCTAGMAMSFLIKVFNPENEIHSNIPRWMLLAMLAVALLTSLIAMIWTLVVDFENTEEK